MALKQYTAATLYPLTLAEVKAYCRVDSSAEDSLITSMLYAATAAAEKETGRSLLPQVWDLTLDKFPSAFELTRAPVVGVVSIIYTDTTGASQTLDPSMYVLDTSDGFGTAYVVPTFSTEWPSTQEQINAVRVRYSAGYTDAATVPEPIKNWIKAQVAAMYENRQAESFKQTHCLGWVNRLLDAYKVY